MHDKLKIWEGVYRSFPETGCNDQLDRDSIWLSKCEAAAREDLASLAAGRPGHGLYQTRNSLLPAVLSVLVHGTELNILDFGGGLGTSYFALKGAKVSHARFHIDVVETPIMCESANRILPTIPELRFLSSVPAQTEKYDVIHAASSLHYVEDWRGLLAKFAALRAKYLVLTELTAGAISTFVTTQRYYEHRIPVWFWSFDEFCEVLRGLGFRLALALPHLPVIRGLPMAPPMENFPEEMRLPYFMDLLFSRDLGESNE